MHAYMVAVWPVRALRRPQDCWYSVTHERAFDAGDEGFQIPSGGVVATTHERSRARPAILDLAPALA